MNELYRMTTVEAAEALGIARIAVLPTGSLEQHGPHLPLGTDSLVADALSRRVAEELGEDAVLCPLIPIGMSEHHLEFAGTLTVRADTYLGLIDDVLESLHHHGIRRVLIVNGHGGNIDALRLAARQARRDRRMLIASTMWSVTAADVASEIATSETYGHACEVETSLMLSLSPDLVDMSAAEEVVGQPSTLDPMIAPPRARVDEPTWASEWSSSGALGEPNTADAEAGAAVVEAYVERVVQFARRMLERGLPEDDA